MKSFVKFLGKLFGKPALEAAAVETAEKRLLKILKLIIFSTVALLFLSACGSDSSTSTNKTYKYSFSVPGCQPTLFQGRFSSQAEMCRALYFQSQNYACAAQETLRYFEAQNCHRSDFLQNQLPGTSMAQPGTFYNHNGQSYMMTPQGPIRLEDQPELDSLRSEFSANDLGDMIIENGVLKRPHENIHMNSSGTKVIIDGNLEIELSNAQPMSVDTEDPRAHTPTGSSTLVAPESVASETRRSTPTPPTTTTPRRLDTSGADLTLDTRSEETDINTAEIPRPMPRPENLTEEQTNEEPTPIRLTQITPSEEETVAADTLTEAPQPTAPITEEAPQSETDAEIAQDIVDADIVDGETTPTLPEEEVSDLSEETSPQDFNLIYYKTNGSLYSEIPNPQNNQRFPLLKITAKIDSRSPLFSKKHSQPTTNLETEILNPAPGACEVLSLVSTNQDIIMLTLKVKDNTNTTQVEACKAWFQTITENNFEIQVPQLQTDQGVVTGRLQFIQSN